MNHTYTFSFEGTRYTVKGDTRKPPDLIVLPDRRIVRTMEIFETFPAQIGSVELLASSPAESAS